MIGEGLYLRNTYFYVDVKFSNIRMPPNQITSSLTLIVYETADPATNTLIGAPIINKTIPIVLNTGYGSYMGFSAATGSFNDVHALEWVEISANSTVPSIERKSVVIA